MGNHAVDHIGYACNRRRIAALGSLSFAAIQQAIKTILFAH